MSGQSHFNSTVFLEGLFGSDSASLWDYLYQLDRELKGLSPSEHSGWINHFRGEIPRTRTVVWPPLQPAEIESWIDHPEEAHRIKSLALLTLHFNGYVRQEAMHQLASLSPSAALPMVIYRANDWVKVIADDASELMSQLITQVTTARLLQCLPLMFHLERVGRQDLSRVVAALTHRLATTETPDTIRSVVESAPEWIRNPLYQSLLQQAGDVLDPLLAIGLEPAHHSLCLIAIRHIRQMASLSDQTRQRLMALRTHRVPQFRHSACRAIVDLGLVEVRPLLETCLSDPFDPLRMWAQSQLISRGVTREDLARFYRQQILRPPERLANYAGLSDTGDSADVPILEALLQHPRSEGRVVGVRGLVQLEAEAAIPKIEPLLNDTSGRVGKYVGKQLIPWPQLCNRAQLRQIVLSPVTEWARRIALEILFTQDRWESLRWLVDLSIQSPDKGAEFTHEALRKQLGSRDWNLRFTDMPDSICNDLQQALIPDQNLLPADIAEALRIRLSDYTP